MAVKIKKPLDFYFNLILIFCFVLFSILLLSCEGESNGKDQSGLVKKNEEKSASSCTVKARFKDFTGLDGCGMMLVLEDGEVLNPIIESQTPSTKEEEFIANKAKDGIAVTISYTVLDNIMSICMKGKNVKIDCIQQ